jgi:hypothetical protein
VPELLSLVASDQCVHPLGAVAARYAPAGIATEIGPIRL